MRKTSCFDGSLPSTLFSIPLSPLTSLEAPQPRSLCVFVPTTYPFPIAYLDHLSTFLSLSTLKSIYI